jgi:hypothetical protein
MCSDNGIDESFAVAYIATTVNYTSSLNIGRYYGQATFSPVMNLSMSFSKGDVPFVKNLGLLAFALIYLSLS